MKKSISFSDQSQLLSWFEKHQRLLPWRLSKDPYAIWVSECMLQQTTSKAVIPYYKAFLKRFPDVSTLASAKLKDLYSLWAGLGYYKRVENLLKSAKEIHKRGGFPKSYKDLLKLPGFGPYTSRAVSSMAFEEPVGVVDGNVIRFLSRFHALFVKSWFTLGRNQLQALSDLWVQNQKASQMNQALMEIGSLICRSRSPLCLSCPLVSSCQAFKKNLQFRLPLKPARKKQEIWFWRVYKIKKAGKWAFVKNHQLPFLKKKPVFPGSCKKLKSPPKAWDFIHRIMHYQIFVRIQNKTSFPERLLWFDSSEIEKRNPSSLIKKSLNFKKV